MVHHSEESAEQEAVNFDETLAFVAADEIARAWKAKPMKHRSAEGIFCLYMDCTIGLSEHKSILHHFGD